MKRISLDLDDKLKRALDIYCAEEGITKRELIIYLIEEKLLKEGKLPRKEGIG